MEADLAEEDNSSPEEEVSFSVKIQQKYELIDGEYWFPSQLNTDFSLFALEDADQENTLMGVGRSYLSEIELLAEVKRKNIFSLTYYASGSDACYNNKHDRPQYYVG